MIMILVAILIVLCLQRFVNISSLKKYSLFCFEFYVDFLQSVLKKVKIVKMNRWVALCVFVLPILILMVFLDFLFFSRAFGFFYLILECVILMFCFDIKTLRDVFSEYCQIVENQDLVQAQNVLLKISNSEIVPSSMPALSNFVNRIILINSYENVFSILFWFSIFGNYGAITYIVLALISDATKNGKKIDLEISMIANVIKNILDWVPIRIFGFSFALVGHFTQVFSCCVKNIKTGVGYNLKFVEEAGLLALKSDLNNEQKVRGEENYLSKTSENKLMLLLIDRILIIWVIVIGLVTFGTLL